MHGYRKGGTNDALASGCVFSHAGLVETPQKTRTSKLVESFKQDARRTMGIFCLVAGIGGIVYGIQELVKSPAPAVREIIKQLSTRSVSSRNRKPIAKPEPSETTSEER